MHYHHHHGYDNPWFLYWAASRGGDYYPPNSAYWKFVKYVIWFPLIVIWAGWIALFTVTEGILVYCLLGG